MNKIAFLVLILTFSGLYGKPFITKKDIRHHRVPLVQRVKEYERFRVLQIKRQIKAVFTVVNDSIDYILTAKGAVKTMVILTPFLVLYCRYFDKNPVQALINKIIQSIGSAEEMYELQREIGKSEAFWKTMVGYPLSMLSVTAQKILEKTVYIGLPFIAGLLVKLGLGVK